FPARFTWAFGEKLAPLIVSANVLPANGVCTWDNPGGVADSEWMIGLCADRSARTARISGRRNHASVRFMRTVPGPVNMGLLRVTRPWVYSQQLGVRGNHRTLVVTTSARGSGGNHQNTVVTTLRNDSQGLCDRG